MTAYIDIVTKIMDITASYIFDLVYFERRDIKIMSKESDNKNETSAGAPFFEVGAKMPDGTIYAGLTPDGRAHIFAMPEDLEIKGTFNHATKAVEKSNSKRAFGHNDWCIPDAGTLEVLCRNHEKGALKETFDKGALAWYWSSTEHPEKSAAYRVYVIRADGSRHWERNDPRSALTPNWRRVHCRSVRLVPARGLAI